MIIFAAEYTSCKYESGYEVISLHVTEKGAETAMKKHKRKQKFKDHMEWRVMPYELNK